MQKAYQHADALHTWVAMTYTPDRVRIEVRDDGKGFDLNEVLRHKGEHLGIQNMQLRAQNLGGSLELETAPGTGTRVILDFPTEERM